MFDGAGTHYEIQVARDLTVALSAGNGRDVISQKFVFGLCIEERNRSFLLPSNELYVRAKLASSHAHTHDALTHCPNCFSEKKIGFRIFRKQVPRTGTRVVRPTIQYGLYSLRKHIASGALKKEKWTIQEETAWTKRKGEYKVEGTKSGEGEGECIVLEFPMTFDSSVLFNAGKREQ